MHVIRHQVAFLDPTLLAARQIVKHLTQLLLDLPKQHLLAVLWRKHDMVLTVPCRVKWFAPGLYDGTQCFGGEESAGASFLRRDGSVWTTDKDGPIMDLLAAEITAKTGKDPGEHYRDLEKKFGSPIYTRIDAPASAEQRARLKKLSPDAVTIASLAGETITAKLTRAPGNDAPIGGLKVVAKSGWFAARPSGTEDIYKIYAESFKDRGHLDAIVEEARGIVSKAMG